MDRRHASGPRTVSTEKNTRTVSTDENMDLLEELAYSQEERCQNRLAPRKIAVIDKEMAKKRNLKQFKRLKKPQQK